MDPIKRNDHNHVYKGPPDTDIGDLSCRVEGPVTFSHFKPSEEELAALAHGAHIELHVIGHPHPPVGIEVVPAVEEESDGSA